MSSRIAALLILMTSPLAAQDESIDRLRTQYTEWRRDIEFHATYQLREGTAESFADVFDGEPFDSVRKSATGVFCKSKDLLRISINYDSQPVVKVDDGRIQLVSNSSEDEVTQGDRWLVYRPAWNGSNDRAVLSRISSSPGRETSTGQYQISPLNPFPGFNPDPFGGEAILGEKPVIEIVSGDDKTLVSITSSTTFGEQTYSQVNTIEILPTAGSFVIQRIHRLITHGNGEPYLEREVRLSGIRECIGGAVASHVLFASRRGGHENVDVTEWVSADLGDREPVDEDFQITIRESTMILGVAAPLPPGQERILDIRDLIER